MPAANATNEAEAAPAVPTAPTAPTAPATPAAAGASGLQGRLRAAIGPICLWASILLFSSSNSVLAWLLDKGPPYFTSCNILCASNLVALGGFPLLFRKDLTLASVKSVTKKQWLGMAISSVLNNVIGALLSVEGLAKTRSVALVAILGRLESVWFLALAVSFLGARINTWITFNALLLLAGVILALVEPKFEGGEVEFNTGVLYLLLSGFGFVVSLFTLKAWLPGVPVGVLALFRVVVGTVFYHLLALVQGSTAGTERLYDWHLWQCMLWYGALFVLFGQALWLVALRECDPGLISLSTSFMFVLNMVWAAILLGRFPSHGEYLGGGIIFIAVVSGLCEERWALKHKKEGAGEKEKGAEAKAQETETGDGEGLEAGGQVKEEEPAAEGATTTTKAAAPAGTLQAADEAAMQNKFV